ncbi:hypothetical protein Taro_005307 [Colocasia esculenta]|uniref:Uncharacterized protein n=1 Tax=Colocasia esculenta TaxID=4460 RepID=A0A843TU88_COLES|nr:hypothetical protein [Colocasia esculenta]
MCEPRLWNSFIRRFEASSDVPQRLDRALNIRERLPHTGVQQKSTQNSDQESFEDSLALAEEGFSGLNLCLWIFQEASTPSTSFLHVSSLHKFLTVVSTQSTCVSTLPVVSTQSVGVSTQSACGVDTVHLCVDTSSLSQKPVLK